MSTTTVSPAFAKKMAQSLSEHKFLPRTAFLELPFSFDIAANWVTAKSLAAEENRNLYKERQLAYESLGFLAHQFDHFDKINVIDIVMESTTTALPLIFELLNSRQMGTYIPISFIPGFSQVSVDKMKIFGLEAGLPKFESQPLLANFCEESYASQLQSVLKNDQQNPKYNSKNCNLFLLLNSSLGRYWQPEQILKNIYNSMGQYDYFVVMHGLHHSGSEMDLVQDYIKLGGSKMGNTLKMAEFFNPQRELEINWDEQIIGGVKISTRVQKDMSFLGIDFKAGEEIILQRNTRFPEDRMKAMLESTGFEIQRISYNKDYAMFLLQKE